MGSRSACDHTPHAAGLWGLPCHTGAPHGACLQAQGGGFAPRRVRPPSRGVRWHAPGCAALGSLRHAVCACGCAAGLLHSVLGCCSPRQFLCHAGGAPCEAHPPLMVARQWAYSKGGWPGSGTQCASVRGSAPKATVVAFEHALLLSEPVRLGSGGGVDRCQCRGVGQCFDALLAGFVPSAHVYASRCSLVGGWVGV